MTSERTALHLPAPTTDHPSSENPGSTMKAVRIHAYGGPNVLRHEDMACPSPGPGEVLVQVRAASVNPVDWKVRSGHVKAMFGEQPFPMILGGDFAGVVSKTGSGVSGYRPGDAVFGMTGLIGAYAE